MLQVNCFEYYLNNLYCRFGDLDFVNEKIIIVSFLLKSTANLQYLVAQHNYC